MDKTTILRRTNPGAIPCPKLTKKKKVTEGEKVKEEIPEQLPLSCMPEGEEDSFDLLFAEDAQERESSVSPHQPLFTEPSWPKCASDLFAGTSLYIPYDPTEKWVDSPIYRHEPSLDETYMNLARQETEQYTESRQRFVDDCQKALDELVEKYPDHRDEITSWYNMIVDTSGKARYDLHARLIALRSASFQFSTSVHVREAIQEELNLLADFLSKFEPLEKTRIDLMVRGAKLFAVWDGVNRLIY